ncbi:MAG: hypothetical protein OEZ13_12665 [Spirochaetia bacterium]|nr:hypothetical protein [Spirochaetia bacterium]
MKNKFLNLIFSKKSFIFLIICFAGLFSSNLFALSSSSKKIKIAVLPFVYEGDISPEEAAEAVKAVKFRLEESLKFRVIDDVLVDEALKDEKLQLSGGKENCQKRKCLVNLARIIKAEKILTGSIDAVDEEIIVKIRILDVIYGSFERKGKRKFEDKNRLPFEAQSLVESLINIYSIDDINFFFIEAEIGWNGAVGLGGRIDFRISEHMTLNLGAGISNWWDKRLSAALRYYLRYPYGYAFSVGGAVSFGRPHKRPIPVLNLSVIKSFRLLPSSRFYFELGYAIPLVKKFYYDERTEEYYSTLAEKEIQKPCGPMISFGFAW